jgi:flagellar brake protein
MTSPLGDRDAAADEIGDVSRFRIHSQMEIIALLRAIAAHRELVTVGFGGSDDFILSVVLAVDDDAGTVVLDHGADPNAMRRLLRAPRLRVVTQLERVRVQFQAGSAQTVVHDGGPALRMRLPESVLRFQKRDTYRLKVPLSRPLICEIPPGESGAARAEVRVRDISIEGVGLTDYPRGFHVVAGIAWQGCRIRLADFGTLVADLEVMRVVDGERPRCGCRFRDLPPAMESLIQRYITRIEREQRATR